MPEDITYEVSGPAAIVTINRPERYNAFRARTVDELIAAFGSAWSDPAVRCVILTGAGDKAFCSGGDVKQRAETGDYGPSESGRFRIGDLHKLIRDIPKPVIAAVNGVAIGGGHVLHVLCDVTIAADTARFGQSGPKVGSFDAGFGTAYLARIVGEKKAREIWFWCRQYSAAEARDMGLVNAVVPAGDLMATAMAWAEEVADKSPTALRFLKQSFNADTDSQAGLSNLAMSALDLFTASPEGLEGAAAFAEKRQPEFGKHVNWHWPMRYALDDEQQAFRAGLRTWAGRVLAPHYQSDDKAAVFRRQQALDLAAMGLTGLRIPDKLGGQEAPALLAGIAAEEVGRADFNAGYLIITTALVSDIIVRNAATVGQQAAWLPAIASGETVPAICITEPGHGTDAAALTMSAVPDGGDWRLTGEKTSITLGMAADRAVVLARTGGPGARGVSAFWVGLDDETVTRAPSDDLGGRAIGRASIHFGGTRVPAENLIGAEGGGFVSVMQGFDYSRAIIGLLCLGAAQQSLDEATAWARDREAFGQPIGAFQGVAFPLAEQATSLRAARHLCYEALWRKDEGLEHSSEAAMAKYLAPKASAEAIHQCLLTFGHLAYSAESPLGQRLRDVIGLEIGDGTAQASKLVIARHLLGRESAP